MTTTLSIEIPNSILLHSIAQIETGAKNANKADPADHQRGKDGEVSRYQIMPSVWKHYTKLRSIKAANPVNYKQSFRIANEILADRIVHFKILKQRNPTIKEIYILWNKPTYAYSGKFHSTKLQETSQRFENLVYENLRISNGKR